jgi:mono/diheme cytochrome c family protein
MAARDDTYRNQRWLDIIFAVSCVVMLVSMVWMFAVDYYREFRPVQIRGREVEVALLRRQADDVLEKNGKELAAAREQIESVLKSQYQQDMPAGTTKDNFLDKAKGIVPVLQNEEIRRLGEQPIAFKVHTEEGVKDQTLKLKDLKALLVKNTDLLSAEKAERDSLVSQRDILQGEGADKTAVAKKEADIKAQEAKVLRIELTVQELERKVRDREAEIARARKPFSDAVAALDRLSKERDRLTRQAQQKEIDIFAKIRALPIVDAFNSPYRIRQDIPDGLLIDYNFKQVNRVDRCATCHMFIDRAGFDKQTLAGLGRPSESKNGEKSQQVALKPSEIAVYCNHPRLDLYVGSNSAHPVEKFGCTVCHSGQGGSATFNFAYHSPDAGKTDGVNTESYVNKKTRWGAGTGTEKYPFLTPEGTEVQLNDSGHKWHADLHPDYMWDYPMHYRRFQESSCLKCHPQVTDLITTNGREEAPKLLKGYRLIRDLGCFGCHEIAGYKSGRSIGPDMRLEPNPPLSDLTPFERAKATADANDPPGTMRKVGPGLRRIAEKTTPEWVAKWIRSPRGFRPDTRMPHFFGVTNNHPNQLSDAQPGESQLSSSQAGLPDAEIQGMAFYLSKASQSYLAGLGELQKMSSAQKQAQQQLRAAFQRLDEARRDNPKLVPLANDPELPPDTPIEKLLTLGEADRAKLHKDQLAAVLAYFQDRERQARAAELLEKRPELKDIPELKNHQTNSKTGGELFQKRSCVACHTHDQVRIYDNDGKLLSAPDFGPNLIGLREKLGFEKKPDQARKWLYYWLANPSDYHPRTAMPTPQLTPGERLDIVTWLFEDGNVKPGEAWKEVSVDAGDIKGLARVYLEKALPKSMAEEIINSGISKETVQSLALRPDSDERLLINDATGTGMSSWSHEDRLKYYVGRKSIGRYGCYACHDIPGFEAAKPIGTPLNDWGKKDSDRLAFENIIDYVTKHHEVPGHRHAGAADSHAHADGHEVGPGPYDPFFFDALEAHRRDGFLHQKLREPRSYDYGKLKDRPWDDRLKMPQFKFAHTKKKKDESDEEFAKRAIQEEREAIEAVMTFILGLTAEPVPLKFVNQPKSDRQHQVRGTRILERHNCIGCHTTMAGSYEFNLDKDMLKQLEKSYAGGADDLKHDPGFPEHISWRNQSSSPPGKGVARGLVHSTRQDEDGNASLRLELWEAIRFPGQDDKSPARQFPAGLQFVDVPRSDALLQHPPTGGNFAEVLARMTAAAEKKSLTGDRGVLMSSVPPPLIREGQKVQPQWLFEFLRHPHAIRPAVQRNLVMPRFNLERDEIEALINYFIAVDRLQNPALGLEYFAQKPAQQDVEFQERERALYRERLRQTLPEAARKDADSADYFENGWRLLTDKNMCIKCHNIGSEKEFQVVESADPAQRALNLNGPNLSMAAERLRPEYLERWVALPKRLIPYTMMVQYEPFFHDAPAYPATPGLSPEERVRAVRDALLSWGYIPNPPPTGKKAGPRGDPHGRDAHSGGAHP